MPLQDRIQNIIINAVKNGECAGANVLVRKNGESILYAEAGMADIESGRPIRRNSIFRLYSQTKPITAAAVMILVERGLIDLMDGVDKYLPGFRNPQMIDAQGKLHKLPRAPWIMELLGMTAGLSYPGEDPAGQYAARVFEDAHAQILAGGGIPTVEFMNRLGEQPLAFQPGTHWRYSTCADVLGAVIEVVSGKRYGDFLREELFEPLGMVDTAFWVPEDKRERFVTCYKRTPEGLRPWLDMNLACGVYDRDPAFESGGAGLVSTLEDYSHFADMLLNKGEYQGKRILSPASVEFMTAPQLTQNVRRDLWDSLDGYNYGKLMRICDEPERMAGLAVRGEYGWDGWLGSYFCNMPDQGITILSMQNTTDCGTSPYVRRVRNAVLAALSRGEI